METNQQLSFLQEKIEEIGSAIFFNESNSVVKLPTAIVSNLKVDDYGFVWFATQKPHEEMKEFETEFPVRLDLFRKGVSFYMNIEGKAWVVTDPEEIFSMGKITEGIMQPDRSDMVLVKVKILKADFHETAKAEKAPIWKNSLQIFYTFLLGSNYQYRTKQSFFAS